MLGNFLYLFFVNVYHTLIYYIKFQGSEINFISNSLNVKAIFFIYSQ